MRNYFLAFFGILLMASCSKDKAPDPNSIVAVCDSTSVSYNRNIKQILDNNCALSGCHDAGTHYNGYDFSNYTSSKDINHAMDNIHQINGAIPMPPSPANKLPDSLISQIEIWVANGYCE